MQPITNQAEQTIAYQKQRITPYIPLIVRELVKTYGIPLGAVFIANLILSVVFSTSPATYSGLLGALISLPVFFGVLAISWRYAENRWHGRSLLMGYSAVSKARRMLQNEIESFSPSDDRIHEMMSIYVQTVEGLMDTMHKYNLIPETIEMA